MLEDQAILQEIDQNIIKETKSDIKSYLTARNLITPEVQYLLNQEYDTLEYFAYAIASNRVIAMSGGIG